MLDDPGSFDERVSRPWVKKGISWFPLDRNSVLELAD